MLKLFKGKQLDMKKARKKFPLYLSEEELDLLKQEAIKQNLSVNEYIRQKALSNASTLLVNKIDVVSEEGKQHHIKLCLTESDFYALKLISAQSGLSMAAYLRNCIRLKKLKLVNITIKHHDLDNHTMLVAEITKKIVSVCNTISASKSAYPQEIKKIKELLEKINNDNIRILDVVYKDRKKLYNDAKKELLKNIREA